METTVFFSVFFSSNFEAACKVNEETSQYSPWDEGKIAVKSVTKHVIFLTGIHSIEG